MASPGLTASPQPQPLHHSRRTPADSLLKSRVIAAADEIQVKLEAAASNEAAADEDGNKRDNAVDVTRAANLAFRNSAPNASRNIGTNILSMGPGKLARLDRGDARHYKKRAEQLQKGISDGRTFAKRYPFRLSHGADQARRTPRFKVPEGSDSMMPPSGTLNLGVRRAWSAPGDNRKG